MNYRQYPVNKNLSAFIECFWTLCADIQLPAERLIPGGRIEWIFNFSSPLFWLISDENPCGFRMSQSILLGQRNRFFFAKQNGATNLLGIRFKPGGLQGFTNYPASLLINRVMPAASVFKFDVDGFEKRLTSEKKEEERIGILEILLAQHLRFNCSAQEKAMSVLDAARHAAFQFKVSDFCEAQDMHYKKLERIFLKFAGYTPISYFQLLRFNYALRQLLDQNKALTKIAYDCGYFDQSHFIRSFKQFAGLCPGDLVMDQNKIVNLLVRHQAV